jgi:hypothetical protein
MIRRQNEQVVTTLNDINGGIRNLTSRFDEGIKDLVSRVDENGRAITCFAKTRNEGSRYSSRRSSRSSKYDQRGRSVTPRRSPGGQAQQEDGQDVQLDYCDEAQEEGPQESYFNRGWSFAFTPFGGDSLPIPRGEPSIKGSPEKLRHSAIDGAKDTKKQPMGNPLLAENTVVELPIDEEEFESRVSAIMLELSHKGKTVGNSYSQKPTESDSIYHTRLYQEARVRARSEVRALLSDKKDVRFSEREPEVALVTTVYMLCQPSARRSGHIPGAWIAVPSAIF